MHLYCDEPISKRYNENIKKKDEKRKYTLHTNLHVEYGYGFVFILSKMRLDVCGTVKANVVFFYLINDSRHFAICIVLKLNMIMIISNKFKPICPEYIEINVNEKIITKAKPFIRQ